MLTRCLNHDAWPCSQSVAIWKELIDLYQGTVKYHSYQFCKNLIALTKGSNTWTTSWNYFSWQMTYSLHPAALSTNRIVYVNSHLKWLLHLRKKDLFNYEKCTAEIQYLLRYPLILQKCNKWHIWMHFSSCFDGSHEDIP